MSNHKTPSPVAERKYKKTASTIILCVLIIMGIYLAGFAIDTYTAGLQREASLGQLTSNRGAWEAMRATNSTLSIIRSGVHVFGWVAVVVLCGRWVVINKETLADL